MQSLCTLRNHCRQWPRNTRYQADATPYLGRTSTGWIAPALPGALIRFTGHCRDMPAALAAADTVVVPAIEPPVLGRVVAQAQAMGRPVVTSDIGILPEHVAAPPEMPEDVRTGWVAKPGDAGDFAYALSEAFALDDTAYRTMAERARHFADYMF